MTDTPDPLADKITALVAETANLRNEVKAERQARQEEVRLAGMQLASQERRMRFNRRMTWAALLFGIVGVLVGVVGITASNRANDAVDTANAERAARTVAACSADNVRVEQARQAVADNASVTLAGLTGSIVPSESTDPARTQAFIDAYRAAVADQVGRTQAQIGFRHADGTIYEKRDCSPEGIAAYYQEQGQQGTTTSSGRSGG